MRIAVYYMQKCFVNFLYPLDIMCEMFYFFALLCQPSRQILLGEEVRVLNLAAMVLFIPYSFAWMIILFHCTLNNKSQNYNVDLRSTPQLCLLNYF